MLRRLIDPAFSFSDFQRFSFFRSHAATSDCPAFSFSDFQRFSFFRE
jgi:hypothetical protein